MAAYETCVGTTSTGNYSPILLSNPISCLDETTWFQSVESNMHIYPNPTSGEFSISFSNTWGNTVNYIVTNKIGQKVFDETGFKNEWKVIHSINLPDELTAGIYTITILTACKRESRNFVIVKLLLKIVVIS